MPEARSFIELFGLICSVLTVPAVPTRPRVPPAASVLAVVRFAPVRSFSTARLLTVLLFNAALELPNCDSVPLVSAWMTSVLLTFSAVSVSAAPDAVASLPWALTIAAPPVKVGFRAAVRFTLGWAELALAVAEMVLDETEAAPPV